MSYPATKTCRYQCTCHGGPRTLRIHEEGPDGTPVCGTPHPSHAKHNMTLAHLGANVVDCRLCETKGAV
jgi:hypothetical protein